MLGGFAFGQSWPAAVPFVKPWTRCVADLDQTTRADAASTATTADLQAQPLATIDATATTADLPATPAATLEEQ